MTIGSVHPWMRVWRGLMAAPGVFVCLLMALMALLAPALPAHAMQPIVFGADQDRIEITKLGDYYEGRGDRLQLETAPGADGIVGRMAVRSVTAGTNPSWVVFAIRNPSDKPIERWLTAERYNIIGSGVVWPDLDVRRIEALTPSVGFVPERVKSDRADIFRLTVEPGQTVTYVAEMSSERMPSLYLWTALSYEQKQREKSLFNGIMIGIVGLLAIFLTAIFAANHKLIFPSAALVAWCVLAYLCVDFGFWHKLFQLKSEDNAVYRAAAEAGVAASIVIFLYAFLRIGIWHGLIKVLFLLWIVLQISLVAVAVIDPRLASMLARASLLPCAIVGSLVLLFLAMRGQDRALSLVPTWLLLLVWLFGAAVTVNGKLNGDIVGSGLVSGLVLIVVLVGFTVTQFAFRSGEPIYGAAPNALQLRSLAIEGAGAAVWEWNARRDEISVSAAVEVRLGLEEGALSRRVEDFVQNLHQQDRERFKLMLWSVREKNGGEMRLDFRLRKGDGTYRWFELEAASVPHADHKSLKCAGLLRDVTDVKRAHERLVHDAVHDSLTSLPNRELFLDRLRVAMTTAAQEKRGQPVVLFIDIDRFKNVNSSLGLIVGDSMLLTLARRLSRHLGPQDTLARIGGDQFAILLTRAQEQADLVMFAERVRRALRTPMKISGQDIVLTGSIGIGAFDGTQETPQDLLREAENAMYRAKKGGTDRVEQFKPEMRGARDDRVTIESELRQAIEKRQLRLVYQPIMRLPMEELAGFEALVRWHHPRLGVMNPADFVPVAEESDLITKLGSFVLERAAADAGLWQKELPRPNAPLFVSVNVSKRQLFRQDLVTEIRHILGREQAVKGTLHLEVTESLVMENPEQAAEILEWLKGYGAHLSLDDFGTGYSSLSYLHRFAFDTIKIDRSLLRAGSGDSSGHVIIKSMVTLAHELGKSVVVEGVETPEDAAFLRSIGGDFAQGFFYGEPMGERDVLELLRMIRRSDRGMDKSWFGRRPRHDKVDDGQDGEAVELLVAQAPPHEAPRTAAVSMPAPAPAARPRASQPAPFNAPNPQAQTAPARPHTQPMPASMAHLASSPAVGGAAPRQAYRPAPAPGPARPSPPARAQPETTGVTRPNSAPPSSHPGGGSPAHNRPAGVRPPQMPPSGMASANAVNGRSGGPAGHGVGNGAPATAPQSAQPRGTGDARPGVPQPQRTGTAAPAPRQPRGMRGKPPSSLG